MNMVKLSSLREQAAPPSPQAVSMSMDTVGGFESMQRAAKLFSASSIVPVQYQGNVPNCFIAVDMALRMGANPLLVMQNLYIVHGSPAWSAQFLIATFNTSGRFSALRYEFQGTEGKDDWGCRAVATELASGEKLAGPLVTVALAKKNGWWNKPNKKTGEESSKWPTMTEMMLRYRAAAWFVRAYAPEIAMGLKTAEEVQDAVIDVTPLDADLLAPVKPASQGTHETPETKGVLEAREGEVIEVDADEKTKRKRAAKNGNGVAPEQAKHQEQTAPQEPPDAVKQPAEPAADKPKKPDGMFEEEPFE